MLVGGHKTNIADYFTDDKMLKGKIQGYTLVHI